MELTLIDKMSPREWDAAIEEYETKVLFHQSSWLRFIEETQGAETVRFRITDSGKTLGYFAGLVVKKGPLRIFGSPLPGWTTDYMGPIVNKDIDFEKFIDTLDEASKMLKVHHIELCSECLPRELMRSKGYDVQEKSTFVVPLFEDTKKMWDKLDRKCRQNIRKGISYELIVEEWDGPDFADEYYKELIDVFARQRLVPSYPVERVKTLINILRPDAIMTLRVRHEDKTIATIVLPYDKKAAYMFGAASYRKSQNLYPNELLYWTAMRLLAKKGISFLDMCGDGSFKPKFGAREVPVYRYSKSYNFAAKFGREAYRRFFEMKQAIYGRLPLMQRTP